MAGSRSWTRVRWWSHADQLIAWRELMGGDVDRIAWSLDETQLYVLARGGWTVSDATGTRLARRCGWELVLSDQRLAAPPPHARPCLCAD